VQCLNAAGLLPPAFGMVTVHGVAGTGGQQFSFDGAARLLRSIRWSGPLNQECH